MTYEEALQIAMEELYDAVEVLRRNNKGYPSRVDLECNRLLTARNVLCEILEDGVVCHNCFHVVEVKRPKEKELNK